MTTQYSDVQDETIVFGVEGWLDAAMEADVLGQFCEVERMPKNRSDTVEFQRMEALPNTVKVLVEGVLPAASKPTITKVRSQVKQIGDWIEFTDKMTLLTERDIVGKYRSTLGQQGGEMAERFRLEKARSCSNRFYAGSATSIATVNAALSTTLLDRVEAALDRQKAKPITKATRPGLEYDVQGLPPSFIVLAHSDVRKSLRALNTSTDPDVFTPEEKYAPNGMKFMTEMGKVGRMRFLAQTMLEPIADAGAASGSWGGNVWRSTSGANADVYPIIILGQKSMASISLTGLDAVDFHVVPNVATHGNNLGQVGSIGWTSWVGAEILNDMWMAVAYVCVPA